MYRNAQLKLLKIIFIVKIKNTKSYTHEYNIQSFLILKQLLVKFINRYKLNSGKYKNP